MTIAGFFLWLLIFYLIWMTYSINEDKKRERKVIRKEVIKERAKNKRLKAKSDQVFIGVDEGYVREPIPSGIRKTILGEEKVCCHYCGIESTNALVDFHLDHIIPITRGGTSNLNNLIPSCPSCNQEKTNYNPIDYIIFRYLRHFKITEQSLQYLESALTKSLSIEIKDKNRKWWESRVEGIEAFLDFYRMTSEGRGETRVIRNGRVDIFIKSRWGDTKLVSKEVYESSKKGTLILASSRHYNTYVHSYLPKTNSGMLIARIPCLVIKDKSNIKNPQMGESFRFYALGGSEIHSLGFGEKSELMKSGIELDYWDDMRENDGGFLTDIWYSRIERRVTSISYESGAGWIPLKNGTSMRKKWEVMLTFALPKRLVIS